MKKLTITLILSLALNLYLFAANNQHSNSDIKGTSSVENFIEAKQLKLKNSNLLNNDKIFDSDSYDILNIKLNGISDTNLFDSNSIKKYILHNFFFD